MTALVIGAILGLALGAICRACDIPSPAPPTPIGALLVVAMTSGYVVGGMF
jgi:XapX domain-containing protein